jgi:hypothetical protein
MVAFYTAFYNFTRVHQTLRVTAAMEAGLYGSRVVIRGVPVDTPKGTRIRVAALIDNQVVTMKGDVSGEEIYETRATRRQWISI